MKNTITNKEIKQYEEFINVKAQELFSGKLDIDESDKVERQLIKALSTYCNIMLNLRWHSLVTDAVCDFECRVVDREFHNEHAIEINGGESISGEVFLKWPEVKKYYNPEKAKLTTYFKDALYKKLFSDDGKKKSMDMHGGILMPEKMQKANKELNESKIDLYSEEAEAILSEHNVDVRDIEEFRTGVMRMDVSVSDSDGGDMSLHEIIEDKNVNVENTVMSSEEQQISPIKKLLDFLNANYIEFLNKRYAHPEAAEMYLTVEATRAIMIDPMAIGEALLYAVKLPFFNKEIYDRIANGEKVNQKEIATLCNINSENQLTRIKEYLEKIRGDYATVKRQLFTAA